MSKSLIIDNYLTGIRITKRPDAQTQFKPLWDAFQRKLSGTEAGEVWGTQSTGGVFKLNADGIASVFNTLPVGGRAFFDKVAPGVLWIAPGGCISEFRGRSGKSGVTTHFHAHQWAN